MTPSEAAIVLRTVCAGACPEWFVANKFDRMTFASFVAGGPPPAPAPWAMPSKKGKGGGIDLYSSGDLPLQPADKPKQAASGKGAQSGVRVRLQRLEKAADMNGKKGTLVEQVEDGNWVVRLDGGLGDKIVKVSNLTSLSGA